MTRIVRNVTIAKVFSQLGDESTTVVFAVCEQFFRSLRALLNILLKAKSSVPVVRQISSRGRDLVKIP